MRYYYLRRLEKQELLEPPDRSKEQMFTSEIVYGIDFLRVLASLSFLLISSWYDYKFREVSNRIWLLFAPIGFTLTFLQYYLETLMGRTIMPFLYWAVSLGVTTGISLALFYTGFFGGADAKALICLSMAVPAYPKFSPARFYVAIPIFPLAILVNAVFSSSILVLVILCHNIVRYAQLRGEMFRGLEHEPYWRKVLVFITGVKVNIEKLRSGSHYIPLEYLIKEKNGEVTRHLRVTPKLEEENLGDFKKINGQIWATPGLPFLIFITIGFVAALLFGDFTLWIIKLILAF